jgi:hypothetical protein
MSDEQHEAAEELDQAYTAVVDTALEWSRLPAGRGRDLLLEGAIEDWQRAGERLHRAMRVAS